MDPIRWTVPGTVQFEPATTSMSKPASTTPAPVTCDPQTGRFTVIDPLGYVDGPNMYQYVKSNPANWVDPSGRKYMNRAGRRLRDRIINQRDPSPTGTRIVRSLDAEPEKVWTRFSSKARILLVDEKTGLPIPGTERVVRVKDVGKAISDLESQAELGQIVGVSGGTYIPLDVDSEGNVTESEITIYRGSKDISEEGQAQTMEEFENAIFVHESGHGVGKKPAPEETAEQIEQQYIRESQDGVPQVAPEEDTGEPEKEDIKKEEEPDL